MRVLSEVADEHGHVEAIVAELADTARVSERSVQYALRRLEQAGEVAVLRASGRGKRSTYVITVGGLHGDECEKGCKGCTFSPDGPPGKGADSAPFPGGETDDDAQKGAKSAPFRRSSNLNPGTPSRDEEDEPGDRSYVLSNLSDGDQLRRSNSAHRRLPAKPATPALAAVKNLWVALGFGPMSMVGAGEFRGLLAEYRQPLVEEALRRVAFQQVNFPRAWVKGALPGLRNQQQRAGPRVNGNGAALPGQTGYQQSPAYLRARVFTLDDAEQAFARGQP